MKMKKTEQNGAEKKKTSINQLRLWCVIPVAPKPTPEYNRPKTSAMRERERERKRVTWRVF
jgi:hypothetical protein